MKKSIQYLLNCLLGLYVISVSTEKVNAETIYLEDFDYSIGGLPTPSTGIAAVSARWGLWNSVTSTFSEPVNGTKSGFALLTGNDMAVSLNQTDVGGYTPLTSGTRLAIAFFSQGIPISSNAAGALVYSTSNATYQAILTDSSWNSPAINNNATQIPFSFTANTTALVGSFSFNSGNEVISLIPEPSTGALMMIGAVGLVALRRLRKV